MQMRGRQTVRPGWRTETKALRREWGEVYLFRIVLVEPDKAWGQRLAHWLLNGCGWPATRVQVCGPQEWPAVRAQSRPDVVVWDIVSVGASPQPEESQALWET